LLELGEVCELIETTFEITYGYAWINIIMKKYLDIFIINANPLKIYLNIYFKLETFFILS
jgi:hypothetical protein